jgi:hypothetical protein
MQVELNIGIIMKYTEEDEEIVFVDGSIFTGSVIFHRLKGIGWDGGRSCEIMIIPNPSPESDVILLDVKYGKLRRYFYIDVEGVKMWRAEDFINSFRSHIKVIRISPERENLLKENQNET